MIRAFIAIELPPHVIESIGRLQERLKSSDFRISWVRPENIHLTLKFLGDIDSDRVQEIGRLMTRALSRQEPLEIFARGLGVFPGVRSPRVI
jgi:2'-5' RNA ligase